MTVFSLLKKNQRSRRASNQNIDCNQLYQSSGNLLRCFHYGDNINCRANTAQTKGGTSLFHCYVGQSIQRNPCILV